LLVVVRVIRGGGHQVVYQGGLCALRAHFGAGTAAVQRKFERAGLGVACDAHEVVFRTAVAAFQRPAQWAGAEADGRLQFAIVVAGFGQQAQLAPGFAGAFEVQLHQFQLLHGRPAGGGHALVGVQHALHDGAGGCTRTDADAPAAQQRGGQLDGPAALPA
jgi:hypothetical protein